MLLGKGISRRSSTLECRGQRYPHRSERPIPQRPGQPGSPGDNAGSSARSVGGASTYRHPSLPKPAPVEDRRAGESPHTRKHPQHRCRRESPSGIQELVIRLRELGRLSAGIHRWPGEDRDVGRGLTKIVPESGDDLSDYAPDTAERLRGRQQENVRLVRTSRSPRMRGTSGPRTDLGQCGFASALLALLTTKDRLGTKLVPGGTAE